MVITNTTKQFNLHFAHVCLFGCLENALQVVWRVSSRILRFNIPKTDNNRIMHFELSNFIFANRIYIRGLFSCYVSGAFINEKLKTQPHMKELVQIH